MARPHPRRYRGRRKAGGPESIPQGSGHRISAAGRCEMIGRLLAFFAFALLATFPARAADIQNIDLGKNAQVWFAEDHTVPMVAFSISLPAGSAYDPAGKAGLAAFAGAM